VATEIIENVEFALDAFRGVVKELET
jgi:hypothetical protein